MAADLAGDGGDAWRIAERDREPAGAAEQGAVRLEPARPAPAGQPSVGDDDVGFGAGAHHLVPADSGASASPAPAPAAAVDMGRAQVGAARRRRQPVEIDIFRLGAGQLRQRLADIIAGTRTQQRQLPAAGAQDEMLAVAGDDEVRRGRRECPGGARSNRCEAGASACATGRARGRRP